MANITIKLFENTAAAMVAEMRKMEARKGGIDQMLHGDGDSLNAAWGCSAVVLKTGEIQLVGAEATKSEIAKSLGVRVLIARLHQNISDLAFGT